MALDRRFAIVGAGMVGRSLAAALHGRGARVAAIASRRLEAAQAAAQLTGGTRATTDPAEAAREADAVVLAVPDDAIATVCERVAAGGGFAAGDVAIHCSGVLDADVLDAARACGAHALACHPIQTFARVDAALFEGIVCSLEGDAEAVGFGRELAELLGARAVVVRAEDKALYHAALCIACNYFVTLADAGAGLLAGVGFGDAALAALLPLLRGTVGNLERVGLPRALTGPIGRGDVATVERHLAELAARAPALLPLYRVVGLRTIDVALRKGALAEPAARALRAALAD